MAIFASGLKNESRIKMKASGQLVPLETLLLAGISDKLSMLVWFQTEDGQKGRNRPQTITSILTNSKVESTDNVIAFNSGEDFENTRNKLLGGE